MRQERKTAVEKTGDENLKGRRRYGGPRREIPRIKPSADPRLKKVFAQIGVPRKTPFQADPFQLEALAAVRRADCLVSAPTGSGKTWIAQEAIRRIHKKGGRAWYASPLKALSNAKYLEFGRVFGQEQVGILTGDRKENPDAPVIVGTTEILRNQLYDAMHAGTDLGADIVILDEAHFLGDEDRGVVWEEIMIYLPVRVNLLLLSATIANPHQIADWLESIRSKKCVVVEEKARLVPLYPLFFHPSGRLLPLSGEKGPDRKVIEYLRNRAAPVLSSPRRLPPFGEILKVLRKFDLLPAIFFMKSRADCDAALERAVETEEQIGQEREALASRVDVLVRNHPHFAGHRQLWHLKTGAVAAHHSGQLPAWKLIVEDFMTSGLLDAVFATSTVAAGVDFPARSVVFLNSDRYNGREFVPLNGTEFHQTTGRAGRRGKDRIGFAVVIPGKFMDTRHMTGLFKAPPEDVLSQIRVDFSMVLNLLLSHTPEEIRGIFQRSFGTYLSLVNQDPKREARLKEAGIALMSFLPQALCAGPEFVLGLIRQRRALIREISELGRDLKTFESKLAKMANLAPGRLFLDRRGLMYCVFRRQPRQGAPGVLASRVAMGRTYKGRGLRLKWFGPDKVATLLSRVVKLPAQTDPQRINRLIGEVAAEAMASPMKNMPLGTREEEQLTPLKGRLEHAEEELDRMICNQCPHFRTCHGKPKGDFKGALDNFTVRWDTAHAVRVRLWNDFLRHLAFLKEEGFVTQEDKLTYDGTWASQLRLDQPLMIAEGLRQGVFPETDPALLAALAAPFAQDREAEGDTDPSAVPAGLWKAYDTMRRALAPLAERQAIRGFPVRPVVLRPAASVYAWANGQPWERVTETFQISEGDFAMLVSRTADSLRQLASLTEAYPAVAGSAVDAIGMILRGPVAPYDERSDFTPSGEPQEAASNSEIRIPKSGF